MNSMIQNLVQVGIQLDSGKPQAVSSLLLHQTLGNRLFGLVESVFNRSNGQGVILPAGPVK
jgi:hypothetical protein